MNGMLVRVRWSMQCKKVVRECGLRAINVIGIDNERQGMVYKIRRW